MTPIPSGQLVPTADGYDLVLRRKYQAPIADVWASVTEPERTARWIGPWEGDGTPGQTVRLQMVAEEGAPWSDMHIDACRPPHHLAVTSTDAAGTFRLELRLAEEDGTTTLELVQHLDTAGLAADVGPGWEFYLDRLTAARDGSAARGWSDYAGQADYYRGLVDAVG